VPVLPDIVSKALDDTEHPAIITTASEAGVANSVYVDFAHAVSGDKMVVADNHSHKTRDIFLAGSRGPLPLATKEGKAFHVTGSVDHETSGEIYDGMRNNWLDAKYPGHAAVVLNAEEVFGGAERVL